MCNFYWEITSYCLGNNYHIPPVLNVNPSMHWGRSTSHQNYNKKLSKGYKFQITLNKHHDFENIFSLLCNVFLNARPSFNFY